MSQVTINLLPPEIEAQNQARRKRNLSLLISGGALLVFLSFYAALTVATLEVRGEAARIEEERRAVQQEAASYQQYAAMWDQMVRAENLLRQAMGAPPDWLGVMTDIGLQIPGSVWLTEIRVAKAENAAGQGSGPSASETTAPAVAGEVVLRGWTFDHAAVGTWLRALEDVSALSEVRCRFAGGEDSTGESMVQFEITARILPGEPYQPLKGRDVH